MSGKLVKMGNTIIFNNFAVHLHFCEYYLISFASPCDGSAQLGTICSLWRESVRWSFACSEYRHEFALQRASPSSRKCVVERAWNMLYFRWMIKGPCDSLDIFLWENASWFWCSLNLCVLFHANKLILWKEVMMKM